MIRVTDLRLALALLAAAACSADVSSPLTQDVRAGGGTENPSLLPGQLGADTSGMALIPCPTATTQSVTSRIGLAGGVLSIGSTSVVIPLGAVLFPEDFTLTIPASKYAEIRVRAGNAEHYVFRAPVAMTIDYSRCATPALDRKVLSVWNIDPDSKALLEPMVTADDKSTHTVLFTTIHLSGYAVADRADSTGTSGGT